MTAPTEADADWDMEFQALCEAHGKAYVYEHKQEEYGSPADVKDAREQRIDSFDRLWRHIGLMPEMRIVAKIRKMLENGP